MYRVSQKNALLECCWSSAGFFGTPCTLTNRINCKISWLLHKQDKICSSCNVIPRYKTPTNKTFLIDSKSWSHFDWFASFSRTWTAGSCGGESRARRRSWGFPRSRESPTRRTRMGAGGNRKYDEWSDWIETCEIEAIIGYELLGIMRWTTQHL